MQKLLDENDVTFILRDPGDPDVGINGDTAAVSMGTGGLSGADREEFISDVKIRLADCFKEIWGCGKVSCITVDELQTMEARANEIEKKWRSNT